MRKFTILISFLLVFMTYCTSEHREMELFANELGPEKMEALKSLTTSYEQFLRIKYPSHTSESEKSYHFLLDVFQNKSMGFKEIPGIKDILKKMESSGLRKDIYIYESERDSYPGYPVDQLIPIEYPEESMGISHIQSDVWLIMTHLYLTENNLKTKNRNRSLKFNKTGLFIYALAKSKQHDEAFMNYIEAKYKTGDIHPAWLAIKHLEQISEEPFTWFQKLPFIIDVYYKMLLTPENEDNNQLSNI